MEVLMSLQGLQAKGDGPLIIYLLKAYTRICHCLGQYFLPYMSAVMPFFIQCAQLELAMTISTQSDCGTNELDDNSIDKVVSMFVLFLIFYARNDVRIYAVNAMSLLLSSAKLAIEKEIAQGGSESYFTKLSDYIICEPFLTESQVRSMINEIKYVITESSSRKNELTEREKIEDFDAEEAELLSAQRKQEEKVLSYVGKILRTLIKTFKAFFLPFFDELSPYLLPIWAKENTTNERCISILIFDALVDEFPKASLKYYDVRLPLVLEASNDEDPNVRQTALYGLGLWAEYGLSFFKPFVGEALLRIYVVLTHLNACEPENESAYDNDVSTLVFVEVICDGEDLVIEESAKRMINLLRIFQKTLPAATWASACSLLLPQQEMELESILSLKEDANLSSVQ
ncbi:uncharacterized protein [Nicotiana tomentosiformis]|uniref:uncharacterized protein n=1 Tax=Nicotiana tomentosiformis TaxID=4098 RepID=UPI00388CBC47